MTQPNPLAVLDLVEDALATDRISEEVAEKFLGIFTLREQLFLLGRALQVAFAFTEEDLCPTITPVPIT